MQFKKAILRNYLLTPQGLRWIILLAPLVCWPCFLIHWTLLKINPNGVDHNSTGRELMEERSTHLGDTMELKKHML